MKGKRSSGQNTKHMNYRCFWIKDGLSPEGITINYCPTVKLLWKFPNVILVYYHTSQLDEVDGNKLSEERVNNEEESANGNKANINNGKTAKLFNQLPENTERTAAVDAAIVK